MTIPQYRAQFGAEFEAQLHKPWFAALLAVLDAAHPIRKLRTVKDGDKLAGAALYLSQIDGFETCRDIFTQLAQVPERQEPEPPDTFDTDEINPTPDETT